MNADLSVAPEIAQLAAPFAPAAQSGAASPTEGRAAADLADLAAAPERWWDLVRFDPDGPLRIPVPGLPATWLLVLPPGAVAECDCRQATALAGEAAEIAEAAPAGRSLRPGRVLVHGAPAPHRLRAAGPGYSVTLHATVSRPRSLSVKRSSAAPAVIGGGSRSREPAQRILSQLAALSAGTSPCGSTRRIITGGDAATVGCRPELGTS